MLRLQPSQWQAVLTRVTERYADFPVILRQRPVGEKEPHLILWRTPLHHIRVDLDPLGHAVTITAGMGVPPIEIHIRSVEQIELQLSADQSLNFIRFRIQDGSVAVLAFNQNW